MITVNSRRAVFGSNVGCVPSIIWMRSRASRTGSTSDSPREVSSISRPTRTSRGSLKYSRSL